MNMQWHQTLRKKLNENVATICSPMRVDSLIN